MKRFLLWSVVATTLCLPTVAHAEWFYFGAHGGGQFLDLDAISSGQVFNQAVADATADPSFETIAGFEPEPTHYSAENAFVYGGYLGVNLGMFRIGARVTHSMMQVTADDGTDGADIAFELSLLTALVETQIQIPLWIFRPWFSLGLGYAWLGSETKIVHGDASAESDLGTNCFDLMAGVGLDINLGRWFAVGAGVHFSFIGFYYEDPEDPTNLEAAWGFATDYVARLTVRI